MKYTTTNLNLTARHLWRMHEARIANMAWAGAFVATLLLIHSLLSPQPEIAAAPLMAQVQRPVIMVQTATAMPPLPTATPWPTPMPVTNYVEVPGPAPEPEVIYVEVPVAPVYVYVPVEAPPTMPPVEPPPAPTLAPQQMVILDRQQWAEDAAQHNGGSGKAPAPEFAPLDSNAQWCAAAAASGAGARCVKP